MFFKALEIHGFKSFADKKVLTFDKNMTAIVGSNGNGKSNLSDALRWVMGEQGAKTLRSERMEDVIFSGTPVRTQMGFAKVSLSVDNTDRTLSVDSDEVVISRQLYRTGESVYLINGEKSRLKDVQSLLMGTGLGRDGYSIIGQGRVDEIVMSKSSGRREIFEEAAGVSKFLHQKADAERQLEHAEEDILRLMDIESELSGRIPGLQKAAEKAERFVALREEEKQLDINLSVGEYAAHKSGLDQIENDILKHTGQCEHFSREIGELEQQTKEIYSSKTEVTAQREKIRDELETANETLSGLRTDIAVKAGEIKINDGRADDLTRQLSAAVNRDGETADRIAALENECEAKSFLISDRRNLLSELTQKQSELTERHIDLDAANRDELESLNALRSKVQEAALKISASNESIARITAELSEAKEQADKSGQQLSEYTGRLDELNRELSEKSVRFEECGNKLAGHKMLFDTKSKSAAMLKTELEKLREEFVKKETRLKFLKEDELHMSGYGGSVKSVINAAKGGRLSGIVSTVADVIGVDPKYGTAIEVALGAELQSVIVEQEDNAKRAIRYLKENKGGRAKFLPLTSIKPRVMDNALYRALQGGDGYLGLGHELVKYDGRFDSVVKSLLGTTAVCEDIDTASVIAKRHGYRFRIVTLDGQIINQGGSYVGGSVRDTTGIITRKQEIDRLTAEVQSQTDEYELKKGMSASQSAEAQKLAIEIEGIREEQGELDKEIIRVRADIKGAVSMLEQFEAQSSGGGQAVSKAAASLAGEREILSVYTKVKEETELLLAAADERIKGGTGELESAAAEAKELSERIIQLGNEISAAENDIKIIENNIENERKILRHHSENDDILRRETLKLSERNTGLKEEIDALSEKEKEFLSGLSDSDRLEKELRDKFALLEMRQTEISRELKEKNEDKEKFVKELAKSEALKAGSETALQDITERFWDKWNLTMSEAQGLAQPVGNSEDVAEAKVALSAVKQKITALGMVNAAAIEEYAEVSARHKELSEQLADVEKAKKGLLKLIDDLTGEIREKFMNSFGEINHNFRAIFTEIFGGGKAELTLTDPSDVLTSDIEINVAPPGKLVKNIISLSGGEKAMIAITVYLAILLHRPTPFCMLDEVDAALDEANVSKYATYLKRFSNNTQLMLVTHRRGTMEKCDVWYGVLMKDGVSSLMKHSVDDDETTLQKYGVKE